MKKQERKELAQAYNKVISNFDEFELGLCLLYSVLEEKNIINRSEAFLLKKDLNEYLLRSGAPFYLYAWPKRDIDSRVAWIKKRIKYLEANLFKRMILRIKEYC